ncbi:glycosyltransferase [Anderseniella sp. Alg231-50]|uniref:glycosyltransferase n=1 Tax=Anderseniella sp. Alg231-50 TaxID=1922226 RepID=UPI000D560E78
MRVLIVATQILLPDTHGGSTHTTEVVACLRKLGPVCCLAQQGSSGADIAGIGSPARHAPVIRTLMSALNLPAALNTAREFKPDVVYERGSSYGLGAMIAMRLKLPLITMVLDEQVSRLSLHLANTLVATHPGLVPAKYRDKVVQVSWGANSTLFHPDCPASKLPDGMGGKAPLLVYVGSFKKWHGLDLLLQAMSQPSLCNACALLVGDGPLRRGLQHRAKEMGIAGRVHFTGAVPYASVPGFVAASDVCIAPFDPHSHRPSGEGFVLDPLKIFEYLAMEKPTVTIKSENIEALFEDHVHLRLYHPGHLFGLVEAISSLLTEPGKGRTMAGAGRKKVLASHTWEKHADHLYRLFAEAADNRHAGR